LFGTLFGLFGLDYALNARPEIHNKGGPPYTVAEWIINSIFGGLMVRRICWCYRVGHFDAVRIGPAMSSVAMKMWANAQNATTPERHVSQTVNRLAVILPPARSLL